MKTGAEKNYCLYLQTLLSDSDFCDTDFWIGLARVLVLHRQHLPDPPAEHALAPAPLMLGNVVAFFGEQLDVAKNSPSPASTPYRSRSTRTTRAGRTRSSASRGIWVEKKLLQPSGRSREKSMDMVPHPFDVLVGRDGARKSRDLATEQWEQSGLERLFTYTSNNSSLSRVFPEII
jgi:hypothetical protein